MPGGAGAVVAFDLRGGVEAGKRFVDALELHSHLANIGDVRSLVDPPRQHHPQPALRRGAARHRRHPGPGAAVGRAGGHRGHQGRPRSGLPRRQGGWVTLIETALPPATGAWREGDPPGRRQWVRLGRAAAVGVRRRAAGRLDRVRDVGHARARPLQRRPRAARAHRRQPRRRARERRPPHPGLVAGRGRAGSGAGPGALVRRGPQRARRLPGEHRAGRHRAGRAHVGQPLPAGHDPRLGARRDARSPTRSASSGGRASSAARWAGCGRSSGRRPSPTGSPGCSSWPARRRRPRSRSVGARRSWRRSAATSTGAGATTTTPRPGRARTSGWASPAGWRTCPTAARTSSRSGSVGWPSPGRIRPAAVATPWSPTSTTTPTSWCTGSTRRPTCGSRR